MTSSISLSTGPVTWGVDFADAPGNPPWNEVLDDIERSGLGELELGPIGYLPEDSETLRAELGRRRLVAVGSVVFDDLHDPAATEDILTVTARTCRFLSAAAGTYLVIIDRPDEIRAATAGRGDAAPRLDAPRWAAMITCINRMAETARNFGLHPVVHPHAGGYIEFDDEVERLLNDCELDLCIDTGHAAYAGGDPAEAIRRLGDRVGYLHFKDVRPDVLDRAKQEHLSFWEAIRAEIFCPVGDGMVDFQAIFAALSEIGYEGPATIEQDRVAGRGDPLEELRKSVAVLQAAAI